jgi:glycosyltransferase involved in cell wall biosynthesis
MPDMSANEVHSPTPLSLLTFTTLYPNAAQPNHGVFVENRLRHLVGTGQATSTVLAPVPWLRVAAPEREQRHGLTIHHPRFLTIPRIGMRVHPHLLYAAAARTLKIMIDAGARFDAIDAHYFYPDGVAAIWLGRRFGLPVVITARGSDITQFPDYKGPRRLILQAAAAADAIITVSAGLRDALAALGADAGKITVLRNGVDLRVFAPQDRAQARASFGLTGKTAVSVGALIPRKGHDLTIEAMEALPGWTLLIAGDGPERAALLARAAAVGVADRVRLLGPIPHTSLARLFSAADLSVLSSSREGWANVLLESMACGTPVVASPIPGNPEVVQSRAAGVIAEARTPQAIAAAIRNITTDPPARADTRAYAERFGWDETSAGQLALFARVIAKARPSSS